jgi:plastocyanin
MARLLVPILLLVAFAAAGQPPDTGTIIGRVKLTRRIKGAALPSPAYAGRTVAAAAAPPQPEIKNVVVYVKDAAWRGAPPPTKAEMRQMRETFVPHVLAVTRGSRVEFPNDDPFYHNVFSLSSAASFNLGRYANGESRAYEFRKPGIVKVYCNIHSHMSATILVFDHPYFTIPQLDGSYTLPGLPPGDYTVVGWHERVGERTARVHVERGRAAAVDLSLPVEDVP